MSKVEAITPHTHMRHKHFKALRESQAAGYWEARLETQAVCLQTQWLTLDQILYFLCKWQALGK